MVLINIAGDVYVMAMEFDGANDFFQIPSSSLGQNVGRMTCIMKINKDTSTGSRPVFVSTGGSSTSSRFSVEYTSGDRFRIGGRSKDGDGFSSVSTAGTFAVGTWYGFVGDINYLTDSFTMIVYQEGVGRISLESGSITMNGTTSNTPPLNTRICSTGTATQLLDGKIDFLKLYHDAPFTVEEFDAIVLGGQGWDIGARASDKQLELLFNEAPDGNTAVIPNDYSQNNYVLQRNGGPTYRPHEVSRFNRRISNV